MLKVNQLCKSYKTGSKTYPVLKIFLLKSTKESLSQSWVHQEVEKLLFKLYFMFYPN